MLITFIGGDQVLLMSVGAREIVHKDLPVLWNVVEEMRIASGAPNMPKVYIIEEKGLNAFAVGRNPDKAAIAVTSGLLQRLNRDTGDVELVPLDHVSGSVFRLELLLDGGTGDLFKFNTGAPFIVPEPSALLTAAVALMAFLVVVARSRKPVA